MNVRRAIIETILDVLKRQVDKAVERSRFSENSCLFLDPEPITLPKIYVTGHSLGGRYVSQLAFSAVIVDSSAVTSPSLFTLQPCSITGHRPC